MKASASPRKNVGSCFQPFMRGDTARLTIGGTGLGLYIASEIVARHGGAIEVNSTPGPAASSPCACR